MSKKIWVLFFKANCRLNQVGSQRKHKTAACLVLHIRNYVYSQEQTLHHWSFLCRDQQVVMKTLSKKKKEQTQSFVTLLNCLFLSWLFPGLLHSVSFCDIHLALFGVCTFSVISTFHKGTGYEI